jgi:hypothetical protein
MHVMARLWSRPEWRASQNKPAIWVIERIGKIARPAWILGKLWRALKVWQNRFNRRVNRRYVKRLSVPNGNGGVNIAHG